MDDPALQGDEQILIRTQGVHVKSISFEGILTTRRIILVDRIKGVLPPKEIPLSTIQSVEPGENAIRDQVISLGVITRTGGARQMVLTFSREGGGNRAKERDEWVRQIEAHLGAPSFEPVARTEAPGSGYAQPAPDRNVPPQYETPGAYAPSGYPAPTQPRAEPPAAMPAPDPVPAPQETILGTYCTKCGTKVPEGSAFCNKCGTHIMRPGESAHAAAPAPAAVQKARPVEREMQSVEPLMERSTVSAPRDPLRTPPQAPPARPYTAPAPVAAPPAPPAAQVAPAPAKKEKKRFMPKLFSPKDLAPTPLVPPSAKPPAPKKPSNKKKILLIAGVVIVLLIVVVGAAVVLPKTGLLTGLFHGSTSGGSSGATATATVTAKTTSSSGSAAGVVAATLTPVSVPQSGVYVYVNYIGGWKGTYGTANETFKATNSGERILEVVNATGPVSASFGKQDGSSHGLTVTIYKNGKALTTGTSTAANGQVTLSVDTVTGVAQQPLVSGGNSAAVTTTVAAATNTTVKTTTSATANVTAAKITAK
jgi:hypothetical protein